MNCTSIGEHKYKCTGVFINIETKGEAYIINVELVCKIVRETMLHTTKKGNWEILCLIFIKFLVPFNLFLQTNIFVL
jgi:hypothetical protein